MILIGKDIVRQAFWLLFGLTGFAGLYLSLGADFLGFTQVIVYIGGILILSGLLSGQAREILARYRSTGFRLVRRRDLEGWATLALRCVA